ncbi:tryptophan dimethylallyltransferase family protein [Streptomyces sp. NPDC057424]|uniref:tryptophan dimethylallyltransferase family protein n=1 Tax=Streptomyces sp. NPDC057424 TaxID=3346127 RepID=UPI0036C258B2
MTPAARALPGYAEQAVGGLRHLGQVLELGPAFDASAEETVSVLFGGWGHRSTRGPAEPGQPGAPAPFEYSLVLSGDRVDVRLFYRPLAAAGTTTAEASWDAGRHTLAELERRGLAHLQRARDLGDHFRPRSGQASFGMCLAASTAAQGIDRVKVYFDTFAAGTGQHQELIGQALHRLGHGPAWDWVRRHDPAGVAALMPAVFALDLQESADARVKFYTTVHERSAAELAARTSALSDTAGRAAADFVEHMAVDGSAALAGAGLRPTLCWSMTSRRPDRPDDATVYLPSNHYAPRREDITDRLRTALAPGLFRRVERLVAQCAETAPAGGPENPFHWVGTKLLRKEQTFTLYISAAAVEAARSAFPTPLAAAPHARPR